MIDADKEQEALALFIHGKLLAYHEISYEHATLHKYDNADSFFMFCYHKFCVAIEHKAAKMHIRKLAEMKEKP